MPSNTKKISFTLPAELSDQLDEWTAHDQCTRSALIRDAIERYVQEREWHESLERAEKQARSAGITPEDVPRLIEEYRAEVMEDVRAAVMKELAQTNSGRG